jgi:hypothetical protein
MKGRRLPDGEVDYRRVEAGDYWRPENRPEGEWWICDPLGNVGRISKHTVVEHEDGTITVTPSIAATGAEGAWHGWLTRGVWTW